MRPEKDNDIVVSTRIRLARNLKAYPFSSKLTDEQASKMIEEVKSAIDASPAFSKDLSVRPLETMSENEKLSLVERHLISPDFLRKQGPHTLILSKNETVSIMLNEEDHIRLQVIREGFCPEECLKQAILIDQLIDERADIAFDEELGYLTHCPTNLGTGLRVSLMMHLPLLTRAGEMQNMITEAGKLGITVRGIYGEGTSERGDLYQISNQLTLGYTEEEILERLQSVAEQFVERERALRSHLVENGKDQLEDRVWRAVGTLENARILSSKEAESLLSDLRLGMSCQIVKGPDYAFINKLMTDIEPATLLTKHPEAASPADRDRLRASYLRESLRPKIAE